MHAARNTPTRPTAGQRQLDVDDDLPDLSWRSDNMDRIVANRIEQERLFGQQAYLPSICIDLRMQASGASDPWPDEQVAATVAMLRERLACWIPSHATNQRFDDCVRAMIEVTVAEFDGQ